MTERETILTSVDALIAQAETARRERDEERKKRVAAESRPRFDLGYATFCCVISFVLGIVMAVAGRHL